MRQAVGEWNTEATLSRIDAKNQFIWFRGNRDLNGGYFLRKPDRCAPRRAGRLRYAALLLGDFVGKNKNQRFVTARRKTVHFSFGMEC